MLVDLLRNNGWYAYKEYAIEKYSKLSARTGEIKDAGGLIDICGFAHNKKLAIEYDNGAHLKIKSINKLFSSEADFMIGIVRGNHSKSFLRFENTSRIRRVAKEMGVANKTIFLIIVENKIAEWVQI